MFEPIDPLYLAKKFQRVMPARIRRYLNERGILDSVIDLHLLGWNGQRITIPVFDRDGKLAFFKLAKDPDDSSSGPKMMTSPGGSCELYGWERVRVKPCRIVICEGEFDRLVLESQGLAAVTSTGGAGVFRSEWAAALQEIPEAYVCFDNDDAGRNGALRVGRMIPHARIVALPEEVGTSGDVTDFFVRLGKSREDFLRLLEAARPLPSEERAEEPTVRDIRPAPGSDHQVHLLKSSVAIEDLVGRYIDLRKSGQTFMGRCPFHDDNNPSFVIYPKTQTFHCFGCWAHGDVISFLMKVEHLSFPEALKALREITQQHDRGNQTSG